MDGGGVRPRLDLDEGRRDEETLSGGCAQGLDLRDPEHEPTVRGQGGDAFAHVAELGGGGQGAHAHAVVGGVSHRDPAQAVHQVVPEPGRHRSGGHDAADGGALLARLLRHVPEHVLQEELVGLGAGIGVGSQHRRVQAVRLHVHAHRVAQHLGQGAYLEAGVAPPREGHDVLRP